MVNGPDACFRGEGGSRRNRKEFQVSLAYIAVLRLARATRDPALKTNKQKVISE